MGTWSTSINGNDSFQDIAQAFDQHLKRNQSLEAASNHVLSNYSDAFEDFDEREASYFALADRQWFYGSLDDSVASVISQPGFGLATWDDAPEQERRKRTEAIKVFLERVLSPNPVPKKFPKIVVRKPKFKPGDCITYQTRDGQFVAGLVTAVDDVDPEAGRDLIVLMDYLANSPPTLKEFSRRNWLRLKAKNSDDVGTLMCYWYGPEGYRKVSKRLTLVGRIELLDSDPDNADGHAHWEGFGPFVVRRKTQDGG
ncbi:MAG: hypothetical protein WD045_12525 [Pirellulaceae bacterium]